MGKGRKTKEPKPADARPVNRLGDPAIVQLVDALNIKTIPGTRKLDLQTHKDIWTTLQKLEALQGASMLDSMPPREHFLGDFLRWLGENGVDHSGVEVMAVEGKGLGLRTRKDLHLGELILSIPIKVMLTAKDAESGPLVKIQSTEILRVFREMPHVLLAVNLMNEVLAGNSKWKPYFDVLPRSYTLPLYFTPEDMEHLTGTAAVSECINQVRTIASLYANLHRLLRTCPHVEDLPIVAKGFSYHDFRWAVSTVMSRQNKIVLSHKEKVFSPALIPLWDFCNHCQGQISTDFDPQVGMCKCFAQKPFPAGEEILIFYGPRSNLDLLCCSGFVYPDNRHDMVPIRLGLSSSEEKSVSELRMSVLEKAKIPVSGMFRVMKGERPFVGVVLSFVRVFSADRQELQQLLTREESELRASLASSDKVPISISNELKTYDFLAKRCSLLLRPYQTTVEEDDALLKEEAGGLPEKMRHAVLLRRSEKVILKAASEYAAEKHRILSPC